ncbi:Hydroxyacid-oxoacid transhydrogenase, mitochondrial, partial [Armadillidium nasatum]
MGAKNVLVVTDPKMAQMSPVKQVVDSLTKNKINFSLYDQQHAIDAARKNSYDLYISVGGGSVIDTCKVANLYSADPEAELLDYVNAPIGKGLPVKVKLAPHIAVPTTSGTGSETTGVAIFDHKPLKAKTGMGSRALRPTLGIVDPLHALLMPERVAAFSGFDVLCHALESFTAIPFNERSPCPDHPILRPAYQGSNPVSDLWSIQALKIISKYFKRSVYDAGDYEARSQMHFASCLAGIGFGNAGVHLCHGMSYPISGNVKTFQPPDYGKEKSIIPHGLSVVITAPAVFNFTAPICPERHIEAAEVLGSDTRNIKKDDAGKDVLRKYMYELKIEDGLNSLGYDKSDIPELVKGTLPQ